MSSGPYPQTGRPLITSDGDGGALISWMNLSVYKLYARRINKYGFLGGSEVTVENMQVGDKFAITDNAGGAIIAWDASGGQHWIYGQRINGYGFNQWADAGVPICTAPGTGNFSLKQIISDNSHGAIVIWEYAYGADRDIYAQRIDSNGHVLWQTDGIAICAAAGIQKNPVMIPTGSNEVIIAWLDNRSGNKYELYAQKIDAGGNALWTSDGILVRSGENLYATNLAIATDGDGGAIVAWWEWRTAGHGLYAQRIDQDGNIVWPASGVTVCDVPGSHEYPVIIEDGSGGAFIAWTDTRYSGASYDIYAQRINSSGTSLWMAQGIPVCIESGYQTGQQMVPDGEGGIIIVWPDSRDGLQIVDLYAQRVNPSGQIQWATNGVNICNSGGVITSQFVFPLTSDGFGGVIVVWLDQRAGNDQVYATKLDQNGNAPATDAQEVPSIYSLSQNYPNPFNPSTTFHYDLQRTEFVRLSVYDISGKLVRVLEESVKREGCHSVSWDGKNEQRTDVATGIYFYRLDAGSFTQTRKMILLR